MLAAMRCWIVLAFALTASCADGDLDDETAAKADGAIAPGPLVACDGTRAPKTNDRCDSTEVPEDAYCRAGSCDKQCVEECFCKSGRWDCRLFCRDSFGCGTPPLCGVGCGGVDAAVPMDTAVADTSTD